jgi:predicted protein tyrosine phosphatase
MRINALHNCKNPYQGKFPKALCICSAGLLRSPTIAYVLSNNGFNVRAAGVHDYALVPLDEVLYEWADVLVFAEQNHLDAYITKNGGLPPQKPFFVLGIPDMYEFRDPELVKIIQEKLKTTDIYNFVKEQ